MHLLKCIMLYLWSRNRYWREYKDKKDSCFQGVYSLEGERNMQENSSDMSLK